jgi:hypothetical protein
MDYRKEKLLRVWGHEPDSLDDLARCIIAIANTYKESRYNVTKGKSLATAKVVGFSWDINHTSVGNTHYCPYDGVTNWDSDPNKPKDYPGWVGRVWIRYSNYPSSFGFGSDPLRDTLFHTGTGGIGAYNGPWETISKIRYNYYRNVLENRSSYPEINCYSWDCRFFDSDFPDLYKGELFSIIKDLNHSTQHHFLWEDPETVNADGEFISLTKAELVV